MAIDSAAYSPKEFRLAIQAETIIGTKAVNGMTEINVDSVELPSYNPLQVLDVRAGAGRTLKTSDVFTQKDLMDKEISFSGTADTAIMDMLLENLFNAAERAASGGSYPQAYVVPDSFSPNEMKTGQTSSTIVNTVTVAVISPEGSTNSVFPGCRLTSLSISGDMGTENGRIKISGTFKTGYNVFINQGAPSVTAYTSNFLNMNSFTTTKTIAGVTDTILQSFAVNIENPAEYIGYQTTTADLGGGSSTNHDPQVIAVGIPGITATMDATVKYDSQSKGLDDVYQLGTLSNTHLSNNTDWHSATTFGIYSNKCLVTSLAHNEAAAMMLDVSMQMTADSSASAPNDSLIEIIA
tara:strand:+ start:4241 stop:5296 length:1056 start_codon:yes stop_codon:yes gene_type:complete